jgi:hypothetical protein
MVVPKSGGSRPRGIPHGITGSNSGRPGGETFTPVRPGSTGLTVCLTACLSG